MENKIAINYRLTDEHRMQIIDAITADIYFIRGDFENAFQVLNRHWMAEPVELNNINEIYKIVSTEYDKQIDEELLCLLESIRYQLLTSNELSFTEEEFKVFINRLDIIMRIYIGQWDNFDRYSWYNIQTAETLVGEIRNNINPFFDAFGAYSSLGIYSKALHGAILCLYVFYKRLAFALFGRIDNSIVCTDDYEDIKITIAPVKHYVVENIADAEKWLIENISPIPTSFGERQVMIKDEHGLFLYVKPCVSVRIDVGTIIDLNYNNWPTVTVDNKVYDFYSN